MKRGLILTLTIVFSLALNAARQLPVDSCLLHGTLPNGLIYYIRANQTPPNRAQFWLIHKVGSVMEEENERGLAHFLEHMAFTGTKNYTEHELYSYLTRNGMAFGTDVNATTSYDDTQYYINNVPTQRQALLDSLLMIIRDLSCNLLLDSTMIEKERAIIDNERTSHDSYQMRLQEHILPVLMQGSRYANHIPIGLPEVVSQATKQQIEQFYHKWYRPDRQALIIVGDFDAQLMERKVRRIFGVIPSPQTPAPAVEQSVPDHKGLRTAVYTDPEADATMVNIYFKHDDLPITDRNSETYLKHNMIKSLMLNMFRKRLDAMGRKSSCPWLTADANDTHYIATLTKESLAISSLSKSGQSLSTTRDLLTEVRRIVQHGFNSSELTQAKDALSADLKQYLLRAEQHESGDYVSEYIDHFMNGGYIPGIFQEVELSLDAIRQISLKDVNHYFKQCASRENVCLFISGPDSDTYPNDDALQQLFKSVMTSRVEPFHSPNVTTSVLIQHDPEPGKILSRETNDKFQTTTLRLSNGATVTLRPSKLDANVVMFDAIAQGGRWAWDDSYAPQLKVLESVIEESKLGGFSQEQLQQMLVDKHVALSFTLSDDHHDLQGGCASSDIETLLQICYLYFTELTADMPAFNTIMDRMRSHALTQEGKPDTALADSVAVAHFGSSPLVTSLTEAELDRIRYADLLAMYHTYIAHPESFTFILTGDFETGKLIPLIEKYLASLPVDESKPTLAPCHPINILQGKRHVSVSQPSLSERAQIKATISGPSPGTIEDEVMLVLYGHVMEIVFNAAMREEQQLTYGVSTQGQVMRTEPRWILTYQLSCKQANVNPALEETEQMLNLIRERGVSEQLFSKVKQMMLHQLDEDMTHDSYWMNVLCNLALGHDIHTGVTQILESLTESQFNDYISNLSCDTHITITTSSDS